MDKFVQDAFNMAKRSAFDDEFRAYDDYIVNRNKQIVNAVFVKLLMEQKDPEKMAETIVKSGHTEDFSAFVGSLMQVCFHVGYDAGQKSMLEDGK